MKSFVFDKCETKYYRADNDLDVSELNSHIKNKLKKIDFKNRDLIILCIGTDRATGDCLGPLVGERLENTNSSFTVFGTLGRPVHALNINETINYIKRTYNDPFVIAVDASLGSSSHIGYITVSNCPLEPGKGVNKKLPVIGDIAITGIVNVSGKNPNVLQSTRLYTVWQLASCISEVLLSSINYLDDLLPL